MIFADLERTPGMDNISMTPGLIAKVPSSSNPFKSYEVRCGHDGVVYCSCPAWKFQKGKSPCDRTCKHIKAVSARMARKAA